MEYYTVKEAAEIMKTDVLTVYNLITTGEIDAIRCSNILVKEESVSMLIDRGYNID